MQDDQAPHFRIFDPEFPLNFAPNFPRFFKDFPFFNAKSPGNSKKYFTNVSSIVWGGRAAGVGQWFRSNLSVFPDVSLGGLVGSMIPEK